MLAEPPLSVAGFSAERQMALLWHNTSTGENIVAFMNGAAYAGYAWLDPMPATNWEDRARRRVRGIVTSGHNDSAAVAMTGPPTTTAGTYPPAAPRERVETGSSR